MADERSTFLTLSAELTGYDVVELEGTGVADLYLAYLHANAAEPTARLLGAWHAIEAGTAPVDREAALRRDVMADAELGPFARALLALWYTAQWASPDSTKVESLPQAWPEGLAWRAGGTHPTAAKPGGFASWAAPPAEAVHGL
jgi:hypothetical protein